MCENRKIVKKYNSNNIVAKYSCKVHKILKYSKTILQPNPYISCAPSSTIILKKHSASLILRSSWWQLVAGGVSRPAHRAIVADAAGFLSGTGDVESSTRHGNPAEVRHEGSLAGALTSTET